MLWCDATLCAIVYRHMDTTLYGMMDMRRSVFSDDEANCIFSGIAAGLAFLHNLDIVHSDLSAANILMSGSLAMNFGLDVKIADFGSAIDVKSYRLHPQQKLTTIYWSLLVY